MIGAGTFAVVPGRPDDSQVVALYAMALSGAGRGQEALFVVDEALRRPQPDDTLRRLRQSLMGTSGAR